MSTKQPALRWFMRASDDADILVNMNFVRMVVRRNDGKVRLYFSAEGNDHVDVSLADIKSLQEL